MSDKIAEIRARHEEGIRAGADADRAYLLVEVERLREDNEKLRELLRSIRIDGPDFAIRERNEARAEMQRLRAALEPKP